MTNPSSAAASEYAAKAAEVAQKLKPGTYDSVEALALVSIAHSLAQIAQAMESRP
jgi:hypothetical protein